MALDIVYWTKWDHFYDNISNIDGNFSSIMVTLTNSSIIGVLSSQPSYESYDVSHFIEWFPSLLHIPCLFLWSQILLKSATLYLLLFWKLIFEFGEFVYGMLFNRDPTRKGCHVWIFLQCWLDVLQFWPRLFLYCILDVFIMKVTSSNNYCIE